MEGTSTVPAQKSHPRTLFGNDEEQEDRPVLQQPFHLPQEAPGPLPEGPVVGLV